MWGVIFCRCTNGVSEMTKSNQKLKSIQPLKWMPAFMNAPPTICTPSTEEVSKLISQLHSIDFHYQQSIDEAKKHINNYFNQNFIYITTQYLSLWTNFWWTMLLIFVCKNKESTFRFWLGIYHDFVTSFPCQTSCFEWRKRRDATIRWILAKFCVLPLLRGCFSQICTFEHGLWILFTSSYIHIQALLTVSNLKWEQILAHENYKKRENLFTASFRGILDSYDWYILDSRKVELKKLWLSLGQNSLFKKRNLGSQVMHLRNFFKEMSKGLAQTSFVIIW